MLNYIKENFSHFDHIQKSIKKIAFNMDIPIIRDDLVLYLESILSIYSPKKILELGSGLAYSTYLFSKYSDKNCKIVSIDLSIETIQRCKNILTSSKYIEKIEWIHSDALLFLKKNNLKEYDFFFIDALKIDYPKYFLEIYNNIDNGIIILDNLYMNGKVNNKKSIIGQKIHLFNNSLYQYNGKFTFLPIGDGVGIFIK